jgi:transposase
MDTQAERYIGLDIHKAYFVAVGVNAAKEVVLRSQRVANGELEQWIVKVLRPTDAVVLEMTTNTWCFVDALAPHVHSVTVVHPPQVKLITRAQVMTDTKASLILARLHAAGLLFGVWVPPQEVRDLRALVAQRNKMRGLNSKAKCRLQAVLHRLHIIPPPGLDLYSSEAQAWWLSLPVSGLERFRIGSDLDTLTFAKGQIKGLETVLAALAAEDERVPLLVQLPGFGLLTAVTVLAAVGDIKRFQSAEQLVGYAGLGARVHDSGQVHWSGRITKSGRKDLRWVLVQAAHNTVKHHAHWKRIYAQLERRIGRPKAIVAVGRKLLAAVWHVLTKACADRFADPTNVARSFFGLAYDIGVRNLPDGLTALEFTRRNLDRLGIGAELTHVPWGNKTFKLPPSQLAQPAH